MKKIGLLLMAGVLAFASCKTEEPEAEKTFPTDGLTVEEKQRVLVIEQTGAWCQYCPNGAEILTEMIGEHGDDILGLAVHNGDKLTLPVGGLLDNNYPASGVPNFFVMNEDAGQDPGSKIPNYITDVPVFGAAHNVVVTDTAYNVYVKVQVFKDAFGEDFLVNSYLVLDGVLAKDYGSGINLQQTSSVASVQTGSGSTPTKWTKDAALVNGVPLIKAGDNYYHTEVLYTPAKTINPWGKPLADANPFGTDFLKGDILGTRHTPILLSIPRTSLAPFETSLSVVTIVWRLRTDGSGAYDYVNGYMSHIGTH
jgi:thiol-disulfide isomerase/thioredoxin